MAAAMLNATASNETTNRTGCGHEPVDGLTLTIGVLMVVVILGATIGNGLVIAAVMTTKRLKTVTNNFIVSLAFADLFVAGSVMVLRFFEDYFPEWTYKEGWCESLIFLDILFCTASILNLCSISLDRYLAITRPLFYSTQRTNRLSFIMIGIAWVMATLVAVPVFFLREQAVYPGAIVQCQKACRFPPVAAFIIFSASFSFYVPMVVMLFVYTTIFRIASQREKNLRTYRRSFIQRGVSSSFRLNSSVAIPRSTLDQDVSSDADMDSGFRETVFTESNADLAGNEQLQSRPSSCRWSSHKASYKISAKRKRLLSQVSQMSQQSSGSSIPGQLNERDRKKQERALLKKEQKAARTLAIVVGGFLICWLPFFIIYPLELFCKTCWLPETAVYFITWLGYLNSAMNPIIYAFYSADFRQAFLRLTFGRCSPSAREANGRLERGYNGT